MAEPGTIGELEGLLDSVELKLTIPHGEERVTARALGVDPLDAQLRQVYFFDTPDLTLFNRGLVLRARRIQGDDHDCALKIRPVDPHAIQHDWRRREGFKVEVDVVGDKSVCSASFTQQQRPGRIEAVLDQETPLRQLFTKNQHAFLEQHAPATVDWHALLALGPVLAAKLKFVPKGFGHEATLELWRYPDGSALLELSRKVKPEKARAAREEADRYLASLGLKLGGDQETKTRRALEFFAQRAKEDAAAETPAVG